jgi:hypothetical protein
VSGDIEGCSWALLLLVLVLVLLRVLMAILV